MRGFIEDELTLKRIGCNIHMTCGETKSPVGNDVSCNAYRSLLRIGSYIREIPGF